MKVCKSLRNMLVDFDSLSNESATVCGRSWCCAWFAFWRTAPWTSRGCRNCSNLISQLLSTPLLLNDLRTLDPALMKVWSFAEFFAGEANLSAAIKEHARNPAVAIDREYYGELPAMDILTNSGMAWLDKICRYSNV